MYAGGYCGYPGIFWCCATIMPGCGYAAAGYCAPGATPAGGYCGGMSEVTVVGAPVAEVQRESLIKFIIENIIIMLILTSLADHKSHIVFLLLFSPNNYHNRCYKKYRCGYRNGDNKRYHCKEI